VDWDRLGATYDRVANVYEARFAHELDGKPRDRELLGSFAAAVDGTIVGLDLSPEMAKLARARVDAALVADLRRLPFASGQLGAVLALYSLIHVRRAEVPAVFEEFRRVLRPGGRLLLSAHEGQGEVAVDEFLGQPATFVATLFELDELARAASAAGFNVTLAVRRPPYANEGSTTRLYVEAATDR
jgi:SAM-dependent methyltransferase